MRDGCWGRGDDGGAMGEVRVRIVHCVGVCPVVRAGEGVVFNQCSSAIVSMGRENQVKFRLSGTGPATWGIRFRMRKRTKSFTGHM